MKRFVEGVDRGQSTLFPDCLEDWIVEDNPVRVIDAFVDALDLGDLGFSGVAPEATGRPSYHPSVLLKLYIYGYLNRVQSSRRHAPRDRRASIRHNEGPDGRDPLPDENPAEGRHRDGPLRARLQSDAGDEHRRCQAAHGSDRGIAGSVASLTGRLHAQRSSQWLSDANGGCSPRKSPNPA